MHQETNFITLSYFAQPLLIALATYFSTRFWLDKSKQRLATFKTVSSGIGFVLGFLILLRTGEALEKEGYLLGGIIISIFVTPVIVILATAFLGWLVAQSVFLYRKISRWLNGVYDNLPD